MANILLDDLPRKIDDLPINSDFRVCILFELLMQDRAMSDIEKINLALDLFYPNQILDIKKAMENIVWFYACGKINKKTEPKSHKIIYSFDHDADYIFSAFLSDYNINLNTIKYLHWWEFRALFNALTENTLFVKIMGYRAINLSEIKDKETKKYYRKLQIKYRLPDLRTDREKERDFAELLG